ncbi:hypothetical protein IIA79_08475 [bacterium]|nr:hypothetical protein [bacterium]
MNLYMPRFYVRDLAGNLERMEADVAEADKQGCFAILFPEMFLTGYQGENDPQLIRTAFAEASQAHPELLCLFGAISEAARAEPGAESLLRNRLWAYRAGKPIAHYDKVHLFIPNGEHEMWEPGERYVAMSHGSWRVGLMTCNDVRFPEQARALKLEHDVNLLACPALWPRERDHIWAALLRARAIENAVFVAGCCVAGVDNGVENFDGAGNYVFDPLGEQVCASERARKPLLSGGVYELDLSRLDDVLVDTRMQYREISRVELD